MFLERIMADKRAEVLQREAQCPRATLERRAAAMPPARDFRAALEAPGLSVVAEIKRKSPSKGPIKENLDAAGLAALYEEGGAAAVSVLTDAPHFGARERDLDSVRAAVRLPVLRKDFILGEYQVWESRAMGADAMLLIVAALARHDLRHLVALATDLGLCPLVEVHSEPEVEAALNSGARVIGINNRDLKTFEVDIEATHRLLGLLPRDVTAVSESGISAPDHARLVAGWGVDAILVGEALVLSTDPAAMVRSFIEA